MDPMVFPFLTLCLVLFCLLSLLYCYFACFDVNFPFLSFFERKGEQEPKFGELGDREDLGGDVMIKVFCMEKLIKIKSSKTMVQSWGKNKSPAS